MFMIGRGMQAFALVVMGTGVWFGVIHDDMGTEMALTGVALAMFMLGLLFCKKNGK